MHLPVKIYGEDVLERVKGCEWHYSESINRRIASLGDNADEFKEKALNLLHATTKEAYIFAYNEIKDFITKMKVPSLMNWVQWWDTRKHLIFRAFTSKHSPLSNLAKGVHAERKHRDPLGVTLLESCYFDLRDSLLLGENFKNLQCGSYDGGYGASLNEITSRRNKRDVQMAQQIGKDFLDFGVSSVVQEKTIRTSEGNSNDDDGCLPPKRRRSNKLVVFQTRLKRATEVSETMKIRKVEKDTNTKWTFSVASSQSGLNNYKVSIYNSPSCNCSDFVKYGSRVLCQHIIFILLFPLNVKGDHDVFSSRYMADDDLRPLLTSASVDKKYMQVSSSKGSRYANIRLMLQVDPNYGNHQIATLHNKTKRSATCRSCKKIFKVGSLCIKIDGVLTVPIGHDTATVQTVYACVDPLCLRSMPYWTNARYPTSLLSTPDVTTEEFDNCRTMLNIS